MITNSLNIAKDTNLKRATKSLLEELNSITVKKDNEAVIESRATHVINSAINLLAIIKENFPEEQAYELERRFINSIKGGNIPREFIPSVEKGFRESMKNGVLAGFPLESMKMGIPVIGLVPNLVPEWMNEDNGIWINNPNMLTDVIADVVQNWLEDNLNPSLYTEMEKTISNYTDLTKFNEEVIKTFSDMINTRLENFEDQLSKFITTE